MRIKEFDIIRKNAKVYKWFAVAICLWAIFLIILVIIGSIIGRLLRHKLEFTNLYVKDIIAGIPVAVFAIIGSLLLIPISRNAMRKATICPNCGESLLNTSTKPLSIGNCPHCGKQVIDKD